MCEKVVSPRKICMAGCAYHQQWGKERKAVRDLSVKPSAGQICIKCLFLLTSLAFRNSFFLEVCVI